MWRALFLKQDSAKFALLVVAVVIVLRLGIPAFAVIGDSHLDTSSRDGESLL
jgi:hypothetical protein